MNNKNLKTQILELKEKGYSYSEIKNKLGCSKGTIAYHVGINQKEKTNARQQNSRNKIRRFIQEYKSNKCCADCGENYPYWMMEFDHINKDKKFTIGQFSSKTVNLDIVKEEISKCEIVCSNCHRNRTFHRKIKDGDGIGWDYCKYDD